MDDPRATHPSEPHPPLEQTLVGNTPDSALFTLDAGGAVSSWNPGARALTGFQEEEILGRPLAQLAVATTLDSQWTDPLPLVRKEGWLDLETLWLHRDGTPLWVALSLSVLEDPAGEAMGYAVLARLLAGHRQREAALLTRESLFQTFLERNVVGIVVADGEGRHRQANEAAGTLLGYTREELASLNVGDLPMPEDREAARRHFEQVSREGTAEGVFRLRRHDGSPLSVRVHGVRLDSDHMMATFQDADILLRREEEGALREARYQRYLEAAPLAVLITDHAGRILESNPAAREMLGYDSLELASLSGRDIVVETSTDSLRALQQRLDQDGRTESRLRMRRKDGGEVWTDVRAVRLTGDHFMSFCSDITQLVHAEEALRAGERLSRGVLDSLTAHIAVLDRNGTILEVNSRWRGFALRNQAGGHATTEPGANYLEACRAGCDSDVRAREAVAGIRSVLEGNATEFELEYPCPSQGEDLWFRMRVLPLQHGRDGVVVAHEDITERRHFEDVQAFLARSAGSGGDTFLRSLVRFLSERLGMDHVSVDRLEPDGATAWALAAWSDGRPVDPYLYPLAGNPCGDVVEQGYICVEDGLDRRLPGHPLTTALGARSYLGIALRDHGGRTRGIIALAGRRPLRRCRLAESILGLVALRVASEMERLDAEEAVRAAEARFRSLVETSNDLIWEVDAAGVYTYVSPRVEALLGRTPAEVVGRSILEFVDPGEVHLLHSQLEGLAGRLEPIEGLLSTHIHKDGRRVVLESNGRPVLDAAGGLAGYRGVDRDVTARVEAERRSSLQSAVSQVLAEPVDMAVAMRRLFELLCGAESCERGVLWRLDPLDGSLRPLVLWPDAPMGSLPDAGLARQAVALGRAATHGRTRTTPDGAPQPAGSAAAVPVEHGGTLLGVLEAHGRLDRADDPGHMDVLQGIGRQVGQRLASHLAQEELRHVVGSSPSVSYILRRSSGGFTPTWVSENILQVTGYPLHETGGDWWERHVHPDDLERVNRAKEELAEQEHQVVELRLRHRDGHYIWVRDERRTLRDVSGEVVEVVGIWSDVTERVRLEELLRQSQKMEAVGQLAGGVAHDFNNLLTVINGYSDMVLGSLEPDDPNHGLLADIREAGERAAALTRQLLAFSRKQVLLPRQVALGGIVRGLEKMLHRLLGEDVTLRTELPAGLPDVQVDPGQLEQVVVNLCVNARDAMPQGGVITLSTSILEVGDEVGGAHESRRPGRYVVLSVADTGMGMPPEVRSRIFEPFFTTKELGKGTGLGLSTVLGIVEQSGGFLEVDSAPGRGSEFRIHLPALAPGAGPAAREAEAAREAGGGETILLVEDEPAVRDVALRILRQLGYTVHAAPDPRTALEWLAASEATRVDLLLSDVVMPGMGGPELAHKVRGLRPELRVLFMSGYTDDSIGRYGLDQDTTAFLQKPFSGQELAQAVRQVLDEQAPSGAGGLHG